MKNITSFWGKYLVFMAVLGAISFYGAPTTVTAASTYWYTGGNIPAGHLATPDGSGGLRYILNNAITSDLNTTLPGEYCNAYKTGSEIKYQNSFDQSSFTGFNPGTPYYNWQEGDAGSHNICQARGNTWGFKASGALNNNCNNNQVCGMHQFVRLNDWQNKRPWATASATNPKPALSFSLNVKPQVANVSGGAFGYFCPLLKDMSSGNYIEYCFVEWKKGGGFPSIANTDDLGNDSCQSTATDNVDIAFTAFQPGLNWSTQRAGSSDSPLPVPANANLSASITVQNLQNVITRLNGAAPAPHGCNRGLSSDVRDYALVGYEHGLEGGGYSMLGGSVSNVKIATTTDALFANDTLASGQTILSASNGYKTVMQADGNLVTYNSSGSAIWNSGTFGHSGARLVMQGDSNLVIYNTSNTPVWTSNTFGHTGAYVIMQDDGRFVVYRGKTPVWSSW